MTKKIRRKISTNALVVETMTEFETLRVLIIIILNFDVDWFNSSIT